MKFGFIGTGNMGSALAIGVSKTEKDILLYDIFEEKAQTLAEKINAKSVSVQEVFEADFIFLGVKPHQIEELTKTLKISPSCVLVSMAAGVRIEKIEAVCKNPIIRIMPNTPVSVGEGMILYSVNSLVTHEQEEAFLRAMSACGKVQKMEEELIDAGCALSGCGPAYMFMYALGLARGAQKCGIEEEASLKLAAQTMLGAAKLMLASDKSAEELIRAVCSPGGSTIEGVGVLEAEGIYQMCEHTVKAAYEKNKILGK